MNVAIPFIIAAITYSISASLPFWVSRNTQLIVSIFLGMSSSLSWAFIARSVPVNEIPYYGLIFDAMLTVLFLFVPYLFITFDLTNKKMFGIVLVLAGLYLARR